MPEQSPSPGREGAENFAQAANLAELIGDEQLQQTESALSEVRADPERAAKVEESIASELEAAPLESVESLISKMQAEGALSVIERREVKNGVVVMSKEYKVNSELPPAMAEYAQHYLDAALSRMDQIYQAPARESLATKFKGWLDRRQQNVDPEADPDKASLPQRMQEKGKELFAASKEKLSALKEKGRELAESARDKSRSLMEKALHKTIPAGELGEMSPAELLGAARDHLGSLRAYERSHIIRRLAPGELEQAEAAYGEAFKTVLAEEAASMIAEAKANGEKGYLANIKQIMTGKVAEERRLRSETEAKALEKRPAGKALKLYREHPKVRAAIGITLAVGATATGSAAVAGGLLALRAGIAGVGAYVGSKGAMEAGATALAHRSGKSLESMDTQSASQLEGSERIAKLAAFMAQEARGQARSSDEASIEALAATERAVALEELKGASGNYAHQKIANVLSSRLDAEIGTERAKVSQDRRANTKRTAAAFALGAVTAGISWQFSAGRVRDTVGTHHQPPTTGGGGGDVVPPPGAEEAGQGAKEAIKGLNLKAREGDSIWSLAEKTLKREAPGFGNWSPEEKLARIDRLKDLVLAQRDGDWMLNVGERVRMPSRFIKDAMHYNN